MEISFALDNTEWLRHLDETYEDGLQFGIEEFTRAMHHAVVDHTPVDYVTDQGKEKTFDDHIINQWGIEFEPLQGTVWNPSEYGHVLEGGLYPGTGPRTAAGPGGIYSRQAVGGMVQPILDDPDLINQMFDAVITGLDGKLDTVLTRR